MLSPAFRFDPYSPLVDADPFPFYKTLRDEHPYRAVLATKIPEPMTEPKCLVEGLLHQGSKLVLGGGSKSFKSWTLLDLSISVSQGLRWLSFENPRLE